jgi:hypothetical protein
MKPITYTKGADLGDLALTWLADGGVVIDLTGHTFVATIGAQGRTAVVTKSSGITGAATAPNLTIAWATTTDLNDLPTGFYTLKVTATRTSDSKQRILKLPFNVGLQ